MIPTDYQNFIAVSRYARWMEEEGRRETWKETEQRYVDYMSEKVKGQLPKKEIFDAIHNLEVMPSMRALMTAGPTISITLAKVTPSEFSIVTDSC